MSKKFIIVLLSLLLGLLTELQIENNSKNFIFANIDTVGMLNAEIYKKNKEIDYLKELIKVRLSEINRYDQAGKEGNDISEVLEKERIELMKECGYEDMTGQGIIVKMSDNMVSNQADINYDIVHDVDLSIIVNDLKNAGAEAISINGKRILGNSEIKCIGPLVKIDGEGVAAPFVLKAIGEKNMLFAAINAPNTYGYNLMNVYGINIDTIKSNFIVISKSENEIEFNYINNGG